MTENEKQILETKIHAAVKANDDKAFIALFEASLPPGITLAILKQVNEYNYEFLSLFKKVCLHEFLEVVKNGEAIAKKNLSIQLPYTGELSSKIERTMRNNEPYIEEITMLDSKMYVKTGSLLEHIDS